MAYRNRKILSVFLLVILLIALLIITYIALVKVITETAESVSSGNFKVYGTPDPLENTLAHLVSLYKNGELDIVDVSTATTFSWDRLYMFGDYTSPSEVDAVVGKSWRNICYTQVDVSDGYTLLVFTNKNTVVHCLDYPKDRGYFLAPEQAYHEGFSVQDARFVVNEYGDIVWVGDK